MHLPICVTLLAMATAPDTASQTAVATAQVALVSHTSELAHERLSISFFPPTEAQGAALLAATQARIERVLTLLSDEDPNSELSRVNRNAGKPAVALSPDAFTWLARAAQLGSLSGGLFSMTAESLTRAWDYRTTPQAADVARLKERLTQTDDRKLVLNADTHSATLTDPNCSLSLGRLRAALAVDEAIALLQQQGVRQALVMVGSAVRALGRKGDKPWWVGIQDPRASGYFAAVPLEDQAIATEGDYVRFVIRDNVRLTDLVHPGSGSLEALCRSATVIAADAGTAYVLARTLAVAGPDAGPPLVSAVQPIGYVLVDAANTVIVSPALNRRVRMVRPPSQ